MFKQLKQSKCTTNSSCHYFNPSRFESEVCNSGILTLVTVNHELPCCWWYKRIRCQGMSGAMCLFQPSGDGREGGGEKRDGRGQARVPIIPLCEDLPKAACLQLVGAKHRHSSLEGWRGKQHPRAKELFLEAPGDKDLILVCHHKVELISPFSPYT